jgi:nitrile hydratase
MTARFQPGDRVRVRLGSPPGHVRTPTYIQGKTGTVARVHGAYRNPESLAYGGDGLPKRFLYLIRFDQTRIWGAYRGSQGDTLLVDLYEHWLDPA